MRLLKQSAAAQPLVFLMIDSTGHINGKTGLTPTVTLSKAGAAFASPAGAVTEIANGWYKVAGNATDTNTLGPLVLHATGTGADPVDVEYDVVAFDPQDVVRMGLTSLPNVAQGNAGQVATADASARVDVGKVLGTAQTAKDLGASATQTGDAYGRIGAPAGASVSADVAAVKAETATLASRLSAARAGYLDNLNAGSVLASQADINALNQSASRRVILITVGQYERPESGSSAYTVEARTYSADGAIVNADTTPTLTATGIVSGSLAANLSAASSPATGVYRWTYTVASSAALEQVRFDLSATIAAEAWPMAVYSQVADFVAATWTTADRATLEQLSGPTGLQAISDNFVSVNTALTNGTVILGAAQAFDNTGTWTGNVTGSVGSVGSNVNADVVKISGSTPAADRAELWFTDIAAAIAAGGMATEISENFGALSVQIGLLDDLDAAGVRAAVGLASANLDTQIAAVKADTGNLVTRITATLFSGITSLAQWLGLIAGKQVGNTTARTEINATGAGSGTYDETTDSQQAIRDRGDTAWTTGGGGGGGGTAVNQDVRISGQEVDLG